MTSKLIVQIALETFNILLLFGGALGVVIGIMLIVDSARVFRLSDRMNTWISTRQAMRPLETSIPVERALYRRHRIVGALIAVGALYALWFLVLRFDSAQIVSVMRRMMQVSVARWITESIRIFLIVCNAFAVLVGLLVLVRPSLIKGFEEWANRQYSGRLATRPLELPHSGPDRLVRANPRLFGALLTVGGLFVLIFLGAARFLLSR